MRFVTVLLLAAALPAHAADCAALRSAGLPDVSISAAETIAATGKLPAHCRIEGAIDARTGVDGKPYAIGFELRLPDSWQGRFLFQGGGGMDGILRPALGPASAANPVPALARGFAVVSTDAGHKGTSPADPSFSRDQQARIDNAYRSIDRVTAVAKALISRYYGEAWKHAYFDGCSNGGRQALISAQRFPTYFDGIVAGAPAFRVTRAAIGSAWETIAFTKIAPKDEQGHPILSRAYSPEDLKLVANAILKHCDEKDGLKDGLVFNTAACRFDPSILKCQGAKSASCLTGPQVETLSTVFEGPKNSRGDSLYSDWPWDPGIASPGWRALKLGTSQTAQPNSADVTLMLSGLKGYFMTPYNPAFEPMQFDFDRDSVRVTETAALQDAEWTTLSTFSQRGGKLLLYHGMADPFFSATDTTRYYQRVENDNGGPEAVSSWARLFLVPGMTHCGGGPALDNFDALAAVVDWVEQGKAPERIDATGAAFPGKSMPLCAWPKWAHYKGAGSENDARNFECR